MIIQTQIKFICNSQIGLVFILQEQIYESFEFVLSQWSQLVDILQIMFIQVRVYFMHEPRILIFSVLVKNCGDNYRHVYSFPDGASANLYA